MSWEEVTAGISNVMGDEETERAFRQLVKVVGEETAHEIVAKCVSSAGLSTISSPEDLLRFGEALVEVGGFIGVVGRSLRIASICHGAKSPPAREA